MSCINKTIDISSASVFFVRERNPAESGYREKTSGQSMPLRSRNVRCRYMSCILIPAHPFETDTDPHIPDLHTPVQSTPKIKSTKPLLERAPNTKKSRVRSIETNADGSRYKRAPHRHLPYTIDPLSLPPKKPQRMKSTGIESRTSPGTNTSAKQLPPPPSAPPLEFTP
jgi:hypothetical protein